MTIRSYATLILALVLLAPTVTFAQVSGPGPYVSEIRDQCIAEMTKDGEDDTKVDYEILAACKQAYTDEYMEQDSRQATKDKKHVVMAYAALWIIMTIFVVGMYLRQRKLTAEIASLRADLEKELAK